MVEVETTPAAVDKSALPILNDRSKMLKKEKNMDPS